MIEIADEVHHRPSGENWVVARANEEHVWPAGWPPSRAKLSDCELVAKATPEQRADMEAELKKLPAGDERKIADVEFSRRRNESGANVQPVGCNDLLADKRRLASEAQRRTGR